MAGQDRADTSSDPLEIKVVRNQPADAVDGWWIDSRKITDMLVCRAAFPYFGAPRIAAGGPLANDVVKCQLKPINRDDYTAAFTNAQWERLTQVFATGVCLPQTRRRRAAIGAIAAVCQRARRAAAGTAAAVRPDRLSRHRGPMSPAT